MTNVSQPELEKLMEVARKAAENSYSPYSEFRVGAALRLTNGEIGDGNECRKRELRADDLRRAGGTGARGFSIRPEDSHCGRRSCKPEWKAQPAVRRMQAGAGGIHRARRASDFSCCRRNADDDLQRTAAAAGFEIEVEDKGIESMTQADSNSTEASAAAPLHMIDIIRKKRDGGELDAREIAFVAKGAAEWIDSGGRACGMADGVVDQTGFRFLKLAR